MILVLQTIQPEVIRSVRGDVALEIVRNGDEILEGLAHLASLDVQVAQVDPAAHPAVVLAAVVRLTV